MPSRNAGEAEDRAQRRAGAQAEGRATPRRQRDPASRIAAERRAEHAVRDRRQLREPLALGGEQARLAVALGRLGDPRVRVVLERLGRVPELRRNRAGSAPPRLRASADGAVNDLVPAARLVDPRRRPRRACRAAPASRSADSRLDSSARASAAACSALRLSSSQSSVSSSTKRSSRPRPSSMAFSVVASSSRDWSRARFLPGAARLPRVLVRQVRVAAVEVVEGALVVDRARPREEAADLVRHRGLQAHLADEHGAAEDRLRPGSRGARRGGRSSGGRRRSIPAGSAEPPNSVRCSLCVDRTRSSPCRRGSRARCGCGGRRRRGTRARPSSSSCSPHGS